MLNCQIAHLHPEGNRWKEGLGAQRRKYGGVLMDPPFDHPPTCMKAPLPQERCHRLILPAARQEPREYQDRASALVWPACMTRADCGSLRG